MTKQTRDLRGFATTLGQRVFAVLAIAILSFSLRAATMQACQVFDKDAWMLQLMLRPIAQLTDWQVVSSYLSDGPTVLVFGPAAGLSCRLLHGVAGRAAYWGLALVDGKSLISAKGLTFIATFAINIDRGKRFLP